MKTATIFSQACGLVIIFCLVTGLCLAPQQTRAQENSSPITTESYSREELAQMLAPIALYPDALLSQVLMAATYPIEVIEADRWVKQHPGLTDDALDAKLLNQEWDPSVKAICHFPSILAQMSERIAETTNLGNAFLAQESEMMDVIQQLRASAYNAGNLNSNSEQKVIVEQETIVIEPADPEIIYVPYYDPYYIYGSWWYPAYPPYYWVPPGVSIGIGISFWPGVYFGFTFVDWAYFDWHRHYIYINAHKRPRFVSHYHWPDRSDLWHHSPSHRRGVAYRDKFTAVKYGQAARRPSGFRRDVRGFPESWDNERSRTLTNQDENKTKRINSDHYRQEQQKVETRTVEQKQPDRTQQKRQPINIDRQKSGQQVHETRKPDQQQRNQQSRSEKPSPTRAEEKPQDQDKGIIFNRIEEGNRERQSSERGRSSRGGGNEPYDPIRKNWRTKP